MSDSKKSSSQGNKSNSGMAQDGAIPPAPRLQNPKPAPQQKPTPPSGNSAKK